MWSLLASLPTQALQTVGLSDDLPYGLLIGLLGACLQLAVAEVWRLLASETSQQPALPVHPVISRLHRHRTAAVRWSR